MCFQWVCQVQRLILSHSREGLESMDVCPRGIGLSHVSGQLLTIKALFKMLRVTAVCCLPAAECVLTCGDYSGSIAEGSQRGLK